MEDQKQTNIINQDSQVGVQKSNQTQSGGEIQLASGFPSNSQSSSNQQFPSNSQISTDNQYKPNSQTSTDNQYRPNSQTSIDNQYRPNSQTSTDNQFPPNNQILSNNQMPNQGLPNNQMPPNQGFSQNNQMPPNQRLQQNAQSCQGNMILGQEHLIKYRQKKEQEKAKAKIWFQRLAIPSIVYALIYTFCVYKNICGMAILLWVVASIVYLQETMKRCEIKKKKGSLSLSVVMLLLGVSTILTDNGYIIFMNNVAFFLVVVLFLLYQVADLGNWGIGLAIKELFFAVCGAISNLFSPFIDGLAWWGDYRTHKKKWGNQVGLGLLIAAPCVIILGSFLASADAVFGNFIKSILLEIRFSTIIHLGFLFFFGLFSSYCGVRFCFGAYQEKSTKNVEKIEPIMAITFTIAILLLYLCFCWIQVVYLFTGYGDLPDGMTYASYARTGFFQLLIVCVLNLILVLGIKKYFREHKALNGILLAICGCSYIMIASSVYRMALYISVYRLTFLRVFVLTALLAITFLLTFVVIRIVKKNFPIFKYSVAAVCIIYLAFSFARVDYIIAAYDLAHVDEIDRVERNRDRYSILNYVSELSTDAAPAIRAYLDQNQDIKKQVKSYINSDQTEIVNNYMDQDNKNQEIMWYIDYVQSHRYKIERQGVRTFNISHKIAENVLIY